MVAVDSFVVVVHSNRKSHKGLPVSYLMAPQPWNYQCSPLTKPPENAVGFIYIITCDVDGKMYVGQKSFYSHTTKKVAGRKNRKHTTKESDWKTYWGSSEHLDAAIQEYGLDSFSREIIRICYSKWELGYHEAKEQFDRDVLLHPELYFNRNIARQFFTQANGKTPQENHSNA